MNTNMIFFRKGKVNMKLKVYIIFYSSWNQSPILAENLLKFGWKLIETSKNYMLFIYLYDRPVGLFLFERIWKCSVLYTAKNDQFASNFQENLGKDRILFILQTKNSFLALLIEGSNISMKVVLWGKKGKCVCTVFVTTNKGKWGCFL